MPISPFPTLNRILSASGTKQDDDKTKEAGANRKSYPSSSVYDFKDEDGESQDEKDVDIDALIDDLKSIDGQSDVDDDRLSQPGGLLQVPEEIIQTNPSTGLTEEEVLLRRKKYGCNRMKEEKTNLVLKFLSYFVGPIQFVMEVGSHSENTVALGLMYCPSQPGSCNSGGWPSRLGRFRCDMRSSGPQCRGWICPRVSGRVHRG